MMYYTGYIYKIVNDINNKIYIGKTTKTIIERWKEHLNDSKKIRCANRALYRAMNKYGAEHFHIELVATIKYTEGGKELDEAEQMYIEEFDSYKNGYNSTLGGDGTISLDYEKIVSTYLETLNMRETARILGCSPDSVSNILYKSELVTKEEVQNLKRKPIIAINKDTNKKIKKFDSITQAIKWLKNTNRTKGNPTTGQIMMAVNGKRNIAYGLKWAMA